MLGTPCDIRFGAELAESVAAALLGKHGQPVLVRVRKPKRRLAALEELCYQE
jgi:hypothetical protein